MERVFSGRWLSSSFRAGRFVNGERRYPAASGMRLTGTGYIKAAERSIVAAHASRAISEGRAVFLYRFDVPAASSSFSGPVARAVEVIEGIERAEWALADMAYGGAR